MRSAKRTPRERGLTLVELSVAIGVMVVGVMALAGVMISVSHQREQSSARQRVLGRAQALLEDAMAIPPENVKETYDGVTYAVTGVAGTLTGGGALSVSVDVSEPRLLTMRVTGGWTAAGRTESLSISTRIYNPKG